ncbi:MAG TPA: ADP-ribosyltransferase, partial [Blastocatellia bacterium]|nr:ADP-ribosyltransferase [Blastocatellia bacterium]
EGRLIGSLEQDDGYLSTSLDEDVSRNFASAFPIDHPVARERLQYPVLMRIKARKGQPGAYVSNINREFHPEKPRYDNGESEIMMPRGTKYKVTSGRYELLPDGRKMLILEVEIWQKPKKGKIPKQ